MPLFVKTERFTDKTLKLMPSERQEFLAKHKLWVKSLRASGKKLSSGYLVNQKNEPGGGGLLVIEATSFAEAKSLIQKDPMIANNLVSWELHEWISVTGNLHHCS